MGYEWEVYVWSFIEQEGEYEYLRYWEGDTKEEALSVMERAATEGYGCIKLEWRPGRD